ncbi:MAG: EVE domain-containing protein [Beijerinckiaceae bacterium]|nr:EVE domain-containing protein [Beijerinckiaceae bacterium]MCI0735680.1 EVE domain-containing protein [Beijerinckiaceae bacterium]
MAHWLIKSDAGEWSWHDQVKAGRTGTCWDGVRNHSAKLNLMAMRAGEQAFFYHSGEEREIVGIVEIIKHFYPDPSDPSGKFGMVDVRAVVTLKKPVTLDSIRADSRLAQMVLVTNSRLSVQPVSDAEWNIIRAEGGIT